jgi:hypothetical protein
LSDDSRQKSDSPSKEYLNINEHKAPDQNNKMFKSAHPSESQDHSPMSNQLRSNNEYLSQSPVAESMKMLQLSDMYRNPMSAAPGKYIPKAFVSLQNSEI